jgi:hypothetical protein
MTGCFENLESKTLKSRRSRKKKSGKKRVIGIKIEVTKPYLSPREGEAIKMISTSL